MVKVKNESDIRKTTNEATTENKKNIKQFITKRLDIIDDAREKGIYYGLVNAIKKEIIKLGVKALPVLDELLKEKAYSETTKELIGCIRTKIIEKEAHKNTPKEFDHKLLQSEKVY